VGRSVIGGDLDHTLKLLDRFVRLIQADIAIP
jgi:hypothetical protein